MVAKDIQTELQFKTSKSSGAGGQHVNKVSTKVQLYFEVEKSAFLSDEQKEILLDKLSNRISKEGLLMLSSDTTRSQLTNKVEVINRFFLLIEDTLTPTKKRKKTKPPAKANLKRLLKKKRQSETKKFRKKNNIDF